MHVVLDGHDQTEPLLVRILEDAVAILFTKPDLLFHFKVDGQGCASAHQLDIGTNAVPIRDPWQFKSMVVHCRETWLFACPPAISVVLVVHANQVVVASRPDCTRQSMQLAIYF